MKKEKQQKVKKRPGKLPTTGAVGVVMFFGGPIIALLGAILVKDEERELLRSILIYGGLGIFVVGVIICLIVIAIYRYYDRHPELTPPVSERIIQRVVVQKPTDTQPPTESMAAPREPVGYAPNSQGTVTYVGGNVMYMPSMEAYDFVNMGRYQTLEEKFEQISRMDHTQFVIYVARLFALKGYQVKLTPVIDNYDVDLVVEKMDVRIAVGCLLANKVLCKEDITCVRKGKDHYPVNNCMVLTNMYFDRTALDYAREEKISLVDRNILAEDFMN